jgi:hypothetical protein
MTRLECIGCHMLYLGDAALPEGASTTKILCGDCYDNPPEGMAIG